MKLDLRTKIAVITGAGISAESGIQTFRGAGGLWEGHDIYDVATPEAFERNPELVLKFYNDRRRQLLTCEPNAGHKALVQLEEKYDVVVITQNVDDLHERAGSSTVLHLHGELLKVRSTGNEGLVYRWEKDLKPGDRCKEGHQLRPHIVWFGEMVPMMDAAAAQVRTADILIVIGTSLQVYPAAGLVHMTDYDVPKYVIDPNLPEVASFSNVNYIPQPAGIGTPALVQELLNKI